MIKGGAVRIYCIILAFKFLGVFFGSYGFKLKITQKNERLKLPIFKIDYK